MFRPGDRVVICYAAADRLPNPKWRGRSGIAFIASRGSGSRNVLVSTDNGPVVVPQGTCGSRHA
ncbi:MAG: hypothetical protein BPH100C_186 [Phage 5P_2]|nr:MAG: hypothetical protein BPH100C_186 [Phage 5P_2]